MNLFKYVDHEVKIFTMKQQLLNIYSWVFCGWVCVCVFSLLWYLKKRDWILHKDFSQQFCSFQIVFFCVTSSKKTGSCSLRTSKMTGSEFTDNTQPVYQVVLICLKTKTMPCFVLLTHILLSKSVLETA